jgi:hypothetical protein
MKRLAGLFGAILVVAALRRAGRDGCGRGAPQTGRVLMAFGGDIALPVGEQPTSSSW